MKCIELTPEKFNAKLNTVVRYWNDIDQRGEADNQASNQIKDSCKYIFLRDDGWSIASPEFDSAYQLWPDEWAYCYLLKGESQPPRQLDLNREPEDWQVEDINAPCINHLIKMQK